MFGSIVLVAISCAFSSPLPDPIRKVLEAQLPAWAQVTGNPASPSTALERIAVERATGSIIHLVLLERKVKAVAMHEGDRYWLTEVVWCGAGTGRCDDDWTRPDEAWRSDRNTANHTGYAVYRDSLRNAASTWTESVPVPQMGKKKWDKGVCESGLCFLVSAKDSSVARAAVRPDGTVAFWDGGYILGGALEKEQVHAYKFLLENGHSIPFTNGK
jgi:hypothetical protein